MSSVVTLKMREKKSTLLFCIAVVMLGQKPQMYVYPEF